jgi:hypothetical protein
MHMIWYAFAQTLPASAARGNCRYDDIGRLRVRRRARLRPNAAPPLRRHILLGIWLTVAIYLVVLTARGNSDKSSASATTSSCILMEAFPDPRVTNELRERYCLK